MFTKKIKMCTVKDQILSLVKRYVMEDWKTENKSFRWQRNTNVKERFLITKCRYREAGLTSASGSDVQEFGRGRM